MAPAATENCPAPPGDRACSTVKALEDDMRELRGSVNAKLDAIERVATRLEPLVERLVELRGEHLRHADAIKRIGREVDKQADRIDSHDKRLGVLETGNAVAGVKISGNERMIWASVATVSAIAGPLVVWWLTK